MSLIKSESEKYFKTQYHQPTNEKDLEAFARQILVEFVKELESKKTTVKWNYGLDEVVFLNKLNELKELYELSDDYCDSDVSHGTRATRTDQRD